jgi:hypothetical protein
MVATPILFFKRIFQDPRSLRLAQVSWPLFVDSGLPFVRLRQRINFHEGIARGVIDSAHNRGVAPRRQSGDDG